jgi:hypothetical protein
MNASHPSFGGVPLDSYPEQLRAFSLLSDYFLNGGEQLLMYLGGIDGTGKSHVISAFVRLLKELSRERELYVQEWVSDVKIIMEDVGVRVRWY